MPLATLLRGCAKLLAGLMLAAPLAVGSQAQDPSLPACEDRPTAIDNELYADNIRWCVEHVLHDQALEPLAFTALEAAPDGSLFAARPLAGKVMLIQDSDGDGLPDAMKTFAEGLQMPDGLAYHAGALYVAGGAYVYRISAEGAVETLVDDLPTGSGFASGGLALGDDERLYLALGAPCSLCEFAERERGAIISMDLDGGDRRVFASGFRNPADIAFFRGQLWSLDSAPNRGRGLALDELNRVEAGGFYGFPFCFGRDRPGLASNAGDCQRSIAPVMQFGGGAMPGSLAAYDHDVLPGAADTLIVVLRGDPHQVDLVGYKVIMISFDERDQPLGASILMPYRYQAWQPAYLPYGGDGLYWEQFIHISELGFGFFPQRPLAVAVSPQGGIYISMTGGRIIALRPRQERGDYERLYPQWTPMHPRFDPEWRPAAESEEAQSD